jgi:predicted transcriptional regulator of viral defense system
MERYNLVAITKRIYDSRLSFFTIKTLKDILEVRKESSLFPVIKNLLRAGILVKIERDKYLLKGAKVHDFALANFIYRPSYISFESALNFYGILSQFPYEVTSIT